MSKHQTIKMIRYEIDKINQDIDLKIIKGVSYARDARRHKNLVSQLKRLSGSSTLGSARWFEKTLNFAMFMF